MYAKRWTRDSHPVTNLDFVVGRFCQFLKDCDTIREDGGTLVLLGGRVNDGLGGNQLVFRLIGCGHH